MKTTTFVCVPFTGLGLYGGFRGNRWLRNRIKIFKQFVVPSLLAQTDQDFVLWVAWRNEERDNQHVQDLYRWLLTQPLKVVFTYSGCPFWDDKYSDEEAHERLSQTLHYALRDLIDHAPDADEIIWVLQPSDDLYNMRHIESIKHTFTELPKVQALSYTKGYLCNYNTLEVLEYNPTTNPPFFSIRFPRATFFNVLNHMEYTGPYKSHEYVGDKLTLGHMHGRGFLVGTHGENISTHFNHPFGGEKVGKDVLGQFGVEGVAPLELPLSLRKKVMRKLPYRWQRKLRYLFGERGAARVYEWFRN